jgi:hypothetical protein
MLDRLERAWNAGGMAIRISAVILALSMTGVAAADYGQRPQPVRTDAGGLLHIDPTYFELAAQTGGDFYFWAPGEFARSGLQIPLHDEPVLLAYGRFDGPRRSFEVPVESNVRTLTIFAGAQRRDRAVIVRPGGAVVAAGEAGVTLQTFSHMTIATVQNPSAGRWRIDFEGAGMYSVSAHLRPAAEDSAPSLVDVDFVEPGGRPGHEGLFPIHRDLRKGEAISCTVDVSGAISGVQLAFVTGDERPIATMPIDSEPGDNEHYLGRCLVPGVPFRTVVSGRDARGQAFRRTISPLRTPR